MRPQIEGGLIFMDCKLSRSELLKKITIASFMVEDLGMYLNTHPDDCDAVERYNFFIKEANELKKIFEECFGMIEEHGSTSPCPWNWIKEPWPWEYEANFRL